MAKIGKSFFAHLNFWMQASLLFALFAVGYIVIDKHNARFDLTQDKVFTLSAKSAEIVKGLGSEDVVIKAFFKSDQEGKQELEELVKIYSHANPSIQYQAIDPDRQPGEAARYNVDEYGTILIEKQERRERIREISEEAITGALLKLAQDRRKQVYFVAGHGERNLQDQEKSGYSQLITRLEVENYLVKEIVLAREIIPGEADMLIIAGPQADLAPEELRALKAFLDAGGNVLMMLDPMEAQLDNVTSWLSGYGVTVRQDIIVDKLSRVFGADFLIPVITTYGNHPITENFNVASFLPLTRSVLRAEDVPEGLLVTELALTSQGSWAEQDISELEQGEVTFEEGDFAGPISVAVVVEKDDSPMRLGVFGDSDFADNSHLYLSGNKDLILNSIAWLAGEEKLVTIRPKRREPTPLMLSAKQQKLIFVIPVFLLPILAFGTGLSVLFYRRRYN